MWSAHPKVIFLFDDYFKANPGIKDLPQTGIESRTPSPQSDVIAIRHKEQIGDSFLLLIIFFSMQKMRLKKVWKNVTIK